jgi:hypothetical protein
MSSSKLLSGGTADSNPVENSKIRMQRYIQIKYIVLMEPFLMTGVESSMVPTHPP